MYESQQVKIIKCVSGEVCRYMGKSVVFLVAMLGKFCYMEEAGTRKLTVSSRK